jgi:hypothetical protein
MNTNDNDLSALTLSGAVVLVAAGFSALALLDYFLTQ